MDNRPRQDLEERLAALARRPSAPADLHTFIDALPASQAAGTARRTPFWAKRRTVLPAAIAAALIVAFAMSGFPWAPGGFVPGSSGSESHVAVVSPTSPGPVASAEATSAASRLPGSSDEPDASHLVTPAPTVYATAAPPAASFVLDGVTWQAPQTTPMLGIMKVPNGYVATARYGDWTSWRPVVYTSRDGVGWTTPADPSIFVNETGQPFVAAWDGPAAGPGGYVMGGGFADGIGPQLWRSADGVHWKAAEPPPGATAAPGPAAAPVLQVWPASVGYLLSNGAGYWTSVDGFTWAKADASAWRLRTGNGSDLVTSTFADRSSAVSTDDGRTWQAFVGTGAARWLIDVTPFRGSYYAACTLGDTETAGLFRSADLVTWTRVATPTVWSVSVASFAGRLFAVMWREANGGPDLHGELWSSPDGSRWEPVDDGAGRTVSADQLRVVGGRLFAMGGENSWTIQWVGTAS